MNLTCLWGWNLCRAAEGQYCWCLLTNAKLPYSTVIGAHLFKHKWSQQVHILEIDDINDLRNGLPLWKPIEWAFDTSRYVSNPLFDSLQAQQSLSHAITLLRLALDVRLSGFKPSSSKQAKLPAFNLHFWYAGRGHMVLTFVGHPGPSTPPPSFPLSLSSTPQAGAVCCIWLPLKTLQDGDLVWQEGWCIPCQDFGP